MRQTGKRRTMTDGRLVWAATWALLVGVSTLGGCRQGAPPTATTASGPVLDTRADGDRAESRRERKQERREERREERRREEGRDDDRGNDATPLGDEWSPATASAASSHATRPRLRHGRALSGNTPGQFDFYLFTLSWDPEYCASHSGAAECSKHLGFVVHGLWPQDNNGDYPENCSNAAGPADPSKYTNAIPTAGLVEHEWTTHGTCSGLAPDVFFGDVEEAFAALKLPSGLGTGSSATMTPAALIGQLHSLNPAYPASSFAISCGSNYLTAVQVCLDKSLKPEACQAVKTCGATTIKIAAP